MTTMIVDEKQINGWNCVKYVTHINGSAAGNWSNEHRCVFLFRRLLIGFNLFDSLCQPICLYWCVEKFSSSFTHTYHHHHHLFFDWISGNIFEIPKTMNKIIESNRFVLFYIDAMFFFFFAFEAMSIETISFLLLLRLRAWSKLFNSFDLTRNNSSENRILLNTKFSSDVSEKF